MNRQHSFIRFKFMSFRDNRHSYRGSQFASVIVFIDFSIAFYKVKLFAANTKLIGVIQNPLDITALQGDIDFLVRWSDD